MHLLKNKLLFCTFFVVISAMGISICQSLDRIALLIGLNEYEENTQWPSLHGENDLELLHKTLLSKGFSDENIYHLRSAKATKSAIIEAIEEKLLKNARKGAILFFHFSGHGQQIKDDNGDEIDGYDEALVPYNSPKYYQKGVYEGEQLIRDETLGKLFFQIRKNLGPKGQFIVSLDACHSGTGTRGLTTVRGTDVPMADKDYIKNYPPEETESNTWRREVQKKSNRLAPMISFFSSSPQQLSYEYQTDDGTPYGLYTYLLCKNLVSATSSASFQEVFDRIRLEMGSLTFRQIPQAEGDLETLLFNAQKKKTVDYFLPNKQIDQYTLEINGGILNGLNVGSELRLAWDDPDAPAAMSGIVDWASVTESNVVFEKPLPKVILTRARLEVEAYNYGDLVADINLSLPEGALKKELQQTIQESKLMRLVKKGGDVWLLCDDDQQNISIVCFDGTVLMTAPLAPQETYSTLLINIRKTIFAYAQSKFLRELSVPHPLLKGAVELTGKEGRLFLNTSDPVLKCGQEVFLTVKNTGEAPFYFSLADITPNHEKYVVFPMPGKTPEDYYLEPGEAFRFSEGLVVEPPTGLEVLKLIVSTTPLNLKMIEQTRGTDLNNQESPHPLEMLLRETLSDNSLRGSGYTANIPVGSAGVYSFAFEIKE